MNNCQPGILAEETSLARYMTFSIIDADAVLSALDALAAIIDCDSVVVGLGASVLKLLDKQLPELKDYSAQSAPGLDIPATPAACWCWLRGKDRGELFHRSRRIESLLESAFELLDVIDAFQYSDNKDLSGYIDGTENPSGDDAVAAAVLSGRGEGLDGSSFVAVQQWLHDFDVLQEKTIQQQDDIIGRHIANNEEFDSAPDSAHVKRTAQESYQPEAFILRRSMPWTDGMDAGLVFVAFGKSFDAFAAILNRMLGNEDNIVDGLFEFTQPISGAYFWCPPVKNNKLDLSFLR